MCEVKFCLIQRKNGTSIGGAARNPRLIFDDGMRKLVLKNVPQFITVPAKFHALRLGSWHTNQPFMNRFSPKIYFTVACMRYFFVKV